jgi:hypothetical protein
VSVTRRQACDLLAENWGGHLSWDDPEWWDDMCEWFMEFPSVKALRREYPYLRLPRWWPGATVGS